MANGLYDTGRAAFLGTGLQWTSTCTFKVALVASTYSVNLATHQFISDVATAARVASGYSLSALTSSSGVADADDVNFTGISGSKIFSAVVYNDTGTEGTSKLLAYIDTAASLPLTPNGGDILLSWDNGTNKIFRL